MKCFLFVATIKAGNQPSVKNIFPLFFLRHFTLWMLDCQTREPNVKINLPAPKLLWRRMENIRRSFRAEWPEAVNNNNINFHRKDSPQAWRGRERCVVRTERIKMGGGFVIISVLYCTVLYCTVLYLEGMCDWALTTLFSIMILSIWSWNCLASASTVFFSPSFRAWHETHHLSRLRHPTLKYIYQKSIEKVVFFHSTPLEHTTISHIRPKRRVGSRPEQS